MKKAILTLILILITTSMAISAANDNDTTVCFSVNPPMSCVNCENKIKTNLRFEKGIRQIDASAKDAVVTVRFDKKKTSVDKLVAAFKKIGYEAKSVDAAPATDHKCCGNCKSGSSCSHCK